MKEAYLYEKLEQKKVKCHLCNHGCVIKENGKGICGVRENKDGILYCLVYDKVIAAHLDPIEKKPLFHFLPGTTSFSIATVGCNFRCRFCQNYEISQMPHDYKKIVGELIPPDAIVAYAIKNGAKSISYTYTEPTVYFELCLDTSRIATEKGLKNVFVTNGYMTDKCLKEIYPDLHAANVDLKSFKNQFYKDLCGARLEPVLKTLETMKSMNIWVEVTTLIIPGYNDSEAELKEIAKFLVSLDSHIPWHVTRFYPTYKLTTPPPTPVETLRKAREIGLSQGLKYVYTGNIPGDKGENTYCPNCNKILIERHGFYIHRFELKNGMCPHCNTEIKGIWN
jgi:pyruvate formate lyase activating enzyme